MIPDLHPQEINSLNDRSIGSLAAPCRGYGFFVSLTLWMGSESTEEKDARFIPTPFVFGQLDQAHKNFILCQKNSNTMTESSKHFYINY